MKIGFVGLGKMGLNMTKRLVKKIEVIGFDLNKNAIEVAKKEGATIASSIKDLVDKLDDLKIIWVMVPAGDITSKTIDEISTYLKKDDIIIDGGNSYYKDSMKKSKILKEKNIHLLDVGTSGGIFGLKEGYCLMAGGEEEAYKKIEPILKLLSENESFEYMGKSGSGHYVKMVHNAIEYGMMQAYAEGFELFKEKKEFDLDLFKISKLLNKSSVIRSWLLELLENVFKKDQKLNDIEAFVQDSGEGRWSVKEAVDLEVSAPVITSALFERFSSRKKDAFSSKILASLRNEFGGHEIKKK